jgi:hypothetical protein
MPWSKDMQAQAATKGWGIFDVATAKGMRFMALPLTFSVQCPNATHMADLLSRWAQSDKLARTALQFIASNGNK